MYPLSHTLLFKIVFKKYLQFYYFVCSNMYILKLLSCVKSKLKIFPTGLVVVFPLMRLDRIV